MDEERKNNHNNCNRNYEKTYTHTQRERERERKKDGQNEKRHLLHTLSHVLYEYISEKVCRCCKLDKFDNNPDFVWLLFRFFFSRFALTHFLFHSSQFLCQCAAEVSWWRIRYENIESVFSSFSIVWSTDRITFSLPLSNLAKRKPQASKRTKWINLNAKSQYYEKQSLDKCVYTVKKQHF